jgi:hypothetical protein
MTADSGAGFVSDEEACDRAARANDGSAPSSVFNNGRQVNCGTPPGADAAATPDVLLPDGASVDASRDVTAPSDAGSDDASGDGSAAADASAAGDADDASASGDASDDASDDAG